MARAAMATAASQLKPNHVCSVTFECRDLGYGIEAGILDGFWTGETDTWGKRTVRRIDGGATVYLFDDEIISVDPA